MTSMDPPYSIGNSYGSILAVDNSTILDEFIRRTGEGITIVKPKAVEDAEKAERVKEAKQEDDDDDEPKIYLGLSVHGKKRKDLARKGDPNAPDDSTQRETPLLWSAAQQGSTSIIEYLASPAPLAAYKHFISTNPTTKRAKLLSTVNDLEAQLPELLGFNPNTFGESVVLAVTTNCPRDKQLVTLKKLMSVSPRTIAPVVNMSIRVRHFTPLLTVCATMGPRVVYDWLIANGARVEARDERGCVFLLLTNAV